MCTVLLPPGVNPTAVNKYTMYLIRNNKLPQLRHQFQASQRFINLATPVRSSRPYVVTLASIPVLQCLHDDCTLVPKHVEVNMSNCVSNRAYCSLTTIVECKNCHLEFVPRIDLKSITTSDNTGTIFGLKNTPLDATTPRCGCYIFAVCPSLLHIRHNLLTGWQLSICNCWKPFFSLLYNCQLLCSWRLALSIVVQVFPRHFFRILLLQGRLLQTRYA
jgi:hypothetical protein